MAGGGPRSGRAEPPSARPPGSPRWRRSRTRWSAWPRTWATSAFSVLAREGAGILADGRAHPEVESAIAAGRGTGSPLDARGLKPEVRGEFADVRVHADGQADALARSVSARAFTTGSDVWFASGEYKPGTGEGDRLLAHELAHVVQQRGAPASGPLMVSQPGDALETQAHAASGDLLA